MFAQECASHRWRPEKEEIKTVRGSGFASGKGGQNSVNFLEEDRKLKGLPWRLSWYRIHLQCRRPGFDSWVGKIPWRRKRLPTPVFWAGESHRKRSLAGYIQPMGSPKVGHNWAAFTFTGNTNKQRYPAPFPLQIGLGDLRRDSLKSSGRLNWKALVCLHFGVLWHKMSWMLKALYEHLGIKHGHKQKAYGKQLKEHRTSICLCFGSCCFPLAWPGWVLCAGRGDACFRGESCVRGAETPVSGADASGALMRLRRQQWWGAWYSQDRAGNFFKVANIIFRLVYLPVSRYIHLSACSHQNIKTI